jgi:hypothetical protein
MKEYGKTIRTFEDKHVKSIICDNCKKQVFTLDVIEAQKFISINHTCGYGDFSDGDRIECDLCGDCWPKLLPFRLIEEGSEEF